MSSATEKPVGHEQSDVDVRYLFAFAAGLLVTAVFIYVLTWLLFSYFSAREARKSLPEYPLAAEQQTRLPPEPRLQASPRQDLKDLRADEDTLLGGYSWVDRNAGIVRIPIDAAMRLTIERGLPARSGSQASR
jgi:hypothetical protein